MYVAKTLVPALSLGLRSESRQLVAVPTQYLDEGVLVKFGDNGTMTLQPKAAGIVYRTFPDKIKKNTTYTLAYFY